MVDITIITCTGGRPQAFELCKKYMRGQDFQGSVEWVIIDDSSKPMEPFTLAGKPDWKVIVYPGPRLWVEGLNTQRFNMEEALHHVVGNHVFVIEDDDFYSSRYLSTLSQHLNYVDAVGLANSRYYGLHVPGFKLLNNYAHASLANTAFDKKLLPLMQKAVNSGDLYFDIVFWRECRDLGVTLSLLANTKLSVGIKGMPGKSGITGSHRDKDYYVDYSSAKLREWVGLEANNYLPYLKERRGKTKGNVQLPVDAPKPGGTGQDRIGSRLFSPAREEPTRVVRGK